VLVEEKERDFVKGIKKMGEAAKRRWDVRRLHYFSA